ncbi:MAG: glycosyltransferase [Actinobacteria bacterium]|nr:glycosyltransferase [Actinomycetota bacterium]
MKKLFDSLISLNYPRDKFQVIMVDNASEDNSVEFTRINYPFVEILSLEKNLGFAGGNNAGVKIARGDYVAFINNDCEVEREWLTSMVTFLIEKEKEGIKAGGVGSKVYFYFKYLPLTIVLEDQRMQKNKAVEEDGYSGVIRRLRIKESRNYQNIVSKSDDESGYHNLLNFANRSFKYLEGFFDIQKESNKEIIRKIRKEAVIAVPVIDTGNNINLEMDISFLEPDINLKIMCEGEEIFNFPGMEKRDLIFKTLDFIIPEKKFTYARNMINSCGSMINKSFYAREINYESFEENISDKTYEVFAVPGSSFMVKKDVIVETKLFDTKFFTYYEDIDFFWRARLKGWKFFTEPKSVARHFHCGSGQEWSYSFTYHVLRNRLLMIYKCGWFLSFLKNYLSFCAAAFINFVYLIVSKLRGKSTDRIDIPIRIRIFFEFFILMIYRLGQRIKIRTEAVISDEEIKVWLKDF